MDIYKDYMDVIKEAVNTDSSNFINKGLGHPQITRSKEQFNNIYLKASQRTIASSLESFSNKIGTVINYDQQLGLHPDFGHLKLSNATEEHYIVSAFIDIKGSTNLFKKFNKETIFLITNAIQSAGIHTALVFGGYVHRLQGDGIFVYYGGKKTSSEEAVLKALQSVSVYTHFVKNDLKEYFSSYGIENISVRTGIDLGYANDVLWGKAGIGEISEVTTCSLHTSLASKMQSSAQTNGVVVGDNVKAGLGDYDDLFKPVNHRTGNENDRYIFRITDRNFTYTQYDFNWSQFLKKQPFIALDQYGNAIPKTDSLVTPLAIEGLKPIAELNKPYYSNDK
jgi:class 3 adenylate cyclase